MLKLALLPRSRQEAAWSKMSGASAASCLGDHNLTALLCCYFLSLFSISISFFLEEEEKKKLYLARSYKLQSLGFEAWTQHIL